MCRHNVSALNVISFIGLIASTLACLLSFCSPFWLFYPSLFNVWRPIVMLSNSSKTYPFDKAVYRGLWAVSFRDESFVWFWNNNFEPEKSLPDWYITVQGVFAAGLFMFVVAIIIQSIYSCCACCCNRAMSCPTVVASFTITAGLLVGSALSVFGGFSYREGEFEPSVLRDSAGAHLEWAFYVGIAGSGAAILTAIFFYADGCRMVKNYGGYNTPPRLRIKQRPSSCTAL